MKGMTLTLSAVAVVVAVAVAPAVHAQSPAPAQPPSVTPGTPAIAPEELLEQGRWRLPRSHHYELYNTESGSYGKIDVTRVAALADKGQPIYDRTDKVWVFQLGHGPNPRYLAALAPADVLSDGRWRLPRSHHYELYNVESGSYGKIDVSKVAALADKGQPIYDRTDKVWVVQLGHGPNPRYLAALAPADVLSDGRWRLPRSHHYELYNVASGSYGKIDVSKVAALADKGQPIYDRTDKVWVVQLGHGPNPRYLSATTPATPPTPAVSPAPTTAPAGGAAAIGARAPRDKDDCKKDGWKEFTNPAFRNQGDCVSWVNAHR